MYLWLYNSVLGLGTLGKGNRLDGSAGSQYAVGYRSERGDCRASVAKNGIERRGYTGFFYRPGTFAVASYGESEWLGRPAYGRLAEGADKTATQDIKSNA